MKKDRKRKLIYAPVTKTNEKWLKDRRTTRNSSTTTTKACLGVKRCTLSRWCRLTSRNWKNRSTGSRTEVMPTSAWWLKDRHRRTWRSRVSRTTALTLSSTKWTTRRSRRYRNSRKLTKKSWLPTWRSCSLRKRIRLSEKRRREGKSSTTRLLTIKPPCRKPQSTITARWHSTRSDSTRKNSSTLRTRTQTSTLSFLVWTTPQVAPTWWGHISDSLFRNLADWACRSTARFHLRSTGQDKSLLGRI